MAVEISSISQLAERGVLEAITFSVTGYSAGRYKYPKLYRRTGSGVDFVAMIHKGWQANVDEERSTILYTTLMTLASVGRLL